MYYINIFFIYSFIGYIYEILLALIMNNKLDSGFLYGPITPIYGIGVLIILLFSRWLFKKLKLNKYLELGIFFILIILILTSIEWLGGKLLYLLFNKDYWNYSDLPLSIGKYISVEVSLIWGIFSLILLFWIHPLIKKITTKIPKVVTFTLIFAFFIDLIITLINKL